jgi:uncharacterized protein YehS (DUF1456 family)
MSQPFFYVLSYRHYSGGKHKMTKNDILRRFRYALDISDAGVIEIFRLGGMEIGKAELNNLLRKEEDSGYVECSSAVLNAFLDGLILQKRGPREGGDSQQAAASELNNNLILKKIRIALEMNEDEMLATMKLANVVVSKPELSALFRRKGHKNYKECGDQFLRNFLNGLTMRYREGSFADKPMQ